MGIDRTKPAACAPDLRDLRSLGAEVLELRALLAGHIGLMNERDKRYEQSFKESKEAVTAALLAAKEQTAASFAASEKAITKAEAAQLQYNTGHNDLTRKMDAQYKEMLPRPEAESRFRTLEEKLCELRESRSGLAGRSGGVEAFSELLLKMAPILIAAIALIVAFRH